MQEEHDNRLEPQLPDWQSQCKEDLSREDGSDVGGAGVDYMAGRVEWKVLSTNTRVRRRTGVLFMYCNFKTSVPL
jgi:hypothetical protein